MRHHIRVRAPGKINLALTVGPKRADGYHPLATVFQAVSVYDEVYAEHGEPGEICVEVEGWQATSVPVDERNLAYRAAALLADFTGQRAKVGVNLWIEKSIPVAGGMAGGSADAAATLVACNELWGCGVDSATLQQLGAKLGADVPFCLLGHTALGVNRGDKLVNVLSRGTYHWALALNAEPLSTPTVFDTYDGLYPGTDPNPKVSNDLLRALAVGDVVALGKALKNDLEWAALTMRPELREITLVAPELGAIAAIVSGSGPTIAMLMPSYKAAVDATELMMEYPCVSRAIAVQGPVPGVTIID